VDIPPAPSHVRSIPLTEAEKHQYEREVGPVIEAAAGKLIASKGYQNLTDLQHAKVLQDLARKAHAGEEAAALKRIGGPEIRRRMADEQQRKQAAIKPAA
jgi:hypothetical protein